MTGLLLADNIYTMANTVDDMNLVDSYMYHKPKGLL